MNMLLLMKKILKMKMRKIKKIKKKNKMKIKMMKNRMKIKVKKVMKIRKIVSYNLVLDILNHLVKEIMMKRIKKKIN